MRKNMNDIGLYTEPEMARIHEYERLRTDRNGLKFSHVALDFDLDVMKNRAVTAAVRRLLKQLRVTDHIGWEGVGRIGILLPGTDEVGARHFIRNTEELLRGVGGIETTLVSTYPLPEALMAAVSASSTIVEGESAVEAVDVEEVTILPFGRAK